MEFVVRESPFIDVTVSKCLRAAVQISVFVLTCKLISSCCVHLLIANIMHEQITKNRFQLIFDYHFVVKNARRIRETCRSHHGSVRSAP